MDALLAFSVGLYLGIVVAGVYAGWKGYHR